MATNLDLDDKLIEVALKIGRHKTKKEAVAVALKQYIQTLKQRHVVELFGGLDYDENYDYKSGRSR